MAKKIKIFTQVPYKTLGDALSVRKLLNTLKEEKDVEIEWVIIRETPIEDKTVTGIPGVTVSHSVEWDKIDTSSYNDTDIFIIYPHIPEASAERNEYKLTTEFQTFLKKLPQDKQLLTCSEYNAANIDAHQAVRQHYSYVQRLDTGFKKLGIYTEPPKTNTELLQQFQETEKQFSEQLFQSQSETDYFSKNHLYFGYLNTSLEISSSLSLLNKMDRPQFVLNSIRDALRENREQKKSKNIDIVAPVNPEMMNEILQELTAEELAQLGNVTWHSQQQDQSFKKGNGVNVRILNPFPVKHPAMLYLIAQSSPLTMVTGDQSFTEALMYNKLTLYQIMCWKENFFAQFLEEIASFLGGKEAPLYQFYALQNENMKFGRRVVSVPWEVKQAQCEKILNFYHAHKETLLAQQKLFGEYLLKNCDLNATFVSAIRKVMNSHPLLKASANGDEKSIDRIMAEFKIPAGKIDEIRDAQGNTPFLLAAYKQNLPCMERFIRAGANINQVNEDGEHALTWALDQKNVDQLEFLLKNNISLELKYQNKTIVEYAEEETKYSDDIPAQRILYYHSNRTLVKLLESKTVDQYIRLNKEKMLDILRIAARANRADVIIAVMNKIDFENGEARNIFLIALTEATKMGHEQAVQALLTTKQINSIKKSDPDLDAFRKAVESGKQKIAEMLAIHFPEKIVAISGFSGDESPMRIAIDNQDVNMARMLWSHCLAAQKEVFLRQQSVSHKENFICTTLQSMTDKNIIPTLNFLMDEMKLDLNQKFDGAPATPLEAYICNNNVDRMIRLNIVEYLISRGVTFDKSIIGFIEARIKDENSGRTRIWSPVQSIRDEFKKNIDQNIEELNKIKKYFESKLPQEIAPPVPITPFVDRSFSTMKDANKTSTKVGFKKRFFTTHKSVYPILHFEPPAQQAVAAEQEVTLMFDNREVIIKKDASMLEIEIRKAGEFICRTFIKVVAGQCDLTLDKYKILEDVLRQFDAPEHQWRKGSPVQEALQELLPKPSPPSPFASVL